MGRSRTFNPEKYLGRKFNRWTVIEYDHCEVKRYFDKKRSTYINVQTRFFKARCDCGTKSIVIINNLKKGTSKSCGCYKRERTEDSLFSTTHGKSSHPLYTVWKGMKRRCYSKEFHAYHRYGGRGIKICDEWLEDFTNFYNWSIQNGYKKGLTLDRIDNDGNYKPNNCRWATQKEQSNNISRNVKLGYKGEVKTASEWSRIFNVKPGFFYYRKGIGRTDEDIFKELEKAGN